MASTNVNSAWPSRQFDTTLTTLRPCPSCLTSLHRYLDQSLDRSRHQSPSANCFIILALSTQIRGIDAIASCLSRGPAMPITHYYHPTAVRCAELHPTDGMTVVSPMKLGLSSTWREGCRMIVICCRWHQLLQQSLSLHHLRGKSLREAHSDQACRST